MCVCVCVCVCVFACMVMLYEKSVNKRNENVCAGLRRGHWSLGRNLVHQQRIGDLFGVDGYAITVLLNKGLFLK